MDWISELFDQILDNPRDFFLIGIGMMIDRWLSSRDKQQAAAPNIVVVSSMSLDDIATMQAQAAQKPQVAVPSTSDIQTILNKYHGELQ